MKAVMIFPDRKSEKAISGYSLSLTEKMREKGINIKDLDYRAGKPLSLFKKILKEKENRIIHIQHEYNLLGNYGLPFFLLYILTFFKKGKIVTTMHTVLSQKEKFKGGMLKIFLRKLLYKAQNRWINFFSDKVVVHSNFLRDILIKEYGYKKENIDFVPQGVLENIPKYSKIKAKKELNLNGPVYLLIGSLVPDHGHDIIINQADKIGKTILVVANSVAVNNRKDQRTKRYLYEIKSIIKEKSFERFVRLDINKKITDKNPLWWKYFSAADLVLLPYKGGITSGIFAHSMAAKKPVISGDIPFFKEISKKYHCVKISSKKEDYPKAIKEAMEKEEYTRLLKGCKKYLEENNLSKISQQYKKIYSSLQ